MINTISSFAQPISSWVRKVPKSNFEPFSDRNGVWQEFWAGAECGNLFHHQAAIETAAKTNPDKLAGSVISSNLFNWWTDKVGEHFFTLPISLLCFLSANSADQMISWVGDALEKKLRYYLGIFPKWRTPPPFWEPLIRRKKNYRLFCILGP